MARMKKVTKHDWKLLFLRKHQAALFKNCIIVFGGNFQSLRVILIYDIYTEQWGKFVIPNDEDVPGSIYGNCVVTIEKEVYVYGLNMIKDVENNHMWKLITTLQHFYAWRKIKTGTRQNTPSPRSAHSGWEFSGKLWTFGGFGPPLEGYLNDNGEWIGGTNNQVLCFDPSSQEWMNPKCYGTIPSPRHGHATTVVGDHAWVFGGHSNSCLNDLYQFDLLSLTWTEIQTPLTKPEKRKSCSLNAVSEHQIVVHGGYSKISEDLNDTWVFDLHTSSWKQYAADKKFTWNGHTGTTGLDRSVIIIGGVTICCDYDDDDIDEDDKDVDEDRDCTDDKCTCAQIVTTIRLEPKSLQHLAIRTINQNQKVLPWKSCLPKSLIDSFLVTE